MNITKFIKIVFTNILIFVFLLFLLDACIYCYHYKSFYERNSTNWIPEKFGYYQYSLPDFIINKEFFNGKDNIYHGRLPDGLEYKNKPSIILFGCSFAHGQFLNKNQTFSHKLSKLLKRPVYNRAIPGASLQQMYMQSKSDFLYETVKNPDTVIYVMMNDHYRRTLINYFDILSRYRNPHFNVKNNSLIEDNYKNYLVEIIKSTYIFKLLNHIYVENYINNNKNADNLTDITVLYFTETKKELEKKFNKNLNFYVVLYNVWEIPHKDLLKKKLENNGFKVLSTDEITNEDLHSDKYLFQDNYHPKETAWDLLTPLIIDKFNF